MCDFSEGLRLCTCSSQVITPKAHRPASIWTLKRYLGQDWLELEYGRCHVPQYSEADQNAADWIAYHLNDKNGFDNDFVPNNGDVLNLEMINNTGQICHYEFVFQHEQWQQADSISKRLDKNLIIRQGVVKPLIQK